MNNDRQLGCRTKKGRGKSYSKSSVGTTSSRNGVYTGPRKCTGQQSSTARATSLKNHWPKNNVRAGMVCASCGQTWNEPPGKNIIPFASRQRRKRPTNLPTKKAKPRPENGNLAKKGIEEKDREKRALQKKPGGMPTGVKSPAPGDQKKWGKFPPMGFHRGLTEKGAPLGGGTHKSPANKSARNPPGGGCLGGSTTHAGVLQKKRRGRAPRGAPPWP